MCSKSVSNSAHARPKLLAATGRLLLASRRLAWHLSRPGELKTSGCCAHPNQSEGFAWASCWRGCLLRLPCRQIFPQSTDPRIAAPEPCQRSALVRAQPRSVCVHAAFPDPPSCRHPRVSHAIISPPYPQISRHARSRLPRIQRRTSSGFQDNLRAKQRPCKESCEMLPGAESAAP